VSLICWHHLESVSFLCLYLVSLQLVYRSRREISEVDETVSEFVPGLFPNIPRFVDRLSDDPDR